VFGCANQRDLRRHAYIMIQI